MVKVIDSMTDLFASQVKNITKNIRKVRELNYFTQRHVAAKLGMSQNAYSKLETGENALSLEVFLKIAEVFNLTPEELINLKFDDDDQN